MHHSSAKLFVLRSQSGVIAQSRRLSVLVENRFPTHQAKNDRRFSSLLEEKGDVASSKGVSIRVVNSLPWTPRWS